MRVRSSLCWPDVGSAGGPDLAAIEEETDAEQHRRGADEGMMPRRATPWLFNRSVTNSSGMRSYPLSNLRKNRLAAWVLRYR